MKNKHILLITILFAGIVIISATVYKIIKDHNNKLILVSDKFIRETYLKCLKEEKCDEKATFSHLEANKYVSDLYDPITKKIYNKESYVYLKNNEVYIKYIE